MSIEITPSDFPRSFKFDNVGDTVTGTIIDTDGEKYEVEYGCGKFFTADPNDPDVRRFRRSGDPRPLWIIQVQTDLREDDDDTGARTVWASWPAIKAIKAACMNAGVTHFGKGCRFALKYSSDEQFDVGTGKVYTAQVKAAPEGIAIDEPAPAPTPAPVVNDDDLDGF